MGLVHEEESNSHRGNTPLGRHWEALSGLPVDLTIRIAQRSSTSEPSPDCHVRVPFLT